MSGFTKDLCAFCKKFIRGIQKGKKRSSDGSAWLKFYFEHKNTDLNIYKQVHDQCYRKLLKRKNNGRLIDDLAINDNRELSSHHVVDQTLEENVDEPVHGEDNVENDEIIDEDDDDDDDADNEIDELTDLQSDEEVLWAPEVTTAPILLDFAAINNERCITLTGITKRQFFEIWSSIKDYNYNCKMSSINGLGFYLTRLRTGNSLKKLSQLIPIASYFQVFKFKFCI